MLKVALTGTKDGVNKTFTLAQLGTGVRFVVWAGRILKQLPTVSVGPYEYYLNGSDVTLGSAPAASDMLFAYVQTDATLSLEEVTVGGLQNGINIGFAISKVPPVGSSLVLFKNGLVLEHVPSGPTAVQYTQSATALTLGLAPVATDKVRAFIAAPGTALMTILEVTGNQDSANTRFSLSSYRPEQGLEPLLLTLSDGVLQARVLANPTLGQFALASPQAVLLGSAPAAATSLQFVLIGNLKATLNPYRFTSSRVARRLGIMLQRRLDEAELEEVVAQTYREYVEMHQWSFLQVDGSFATEPIKSVGTVTATNSSRIIAGTGTSFTEKDAGKTFRLGTDNASYRVTAVDIARQRLEISPAYVGTTAALQKYTLAQSIYSLGFDVEYLFSITSQYPMREVPLSVLDKIDPTRQSTANTPLYYAYRGRNEAGEMEIEIYPVPTQAMVVRYSAIRRDVCDDPDRILAGIEALIVNASAAASCRVLLLKPDPAKQMQPEVILQLMQAYELKAGQLLERIDALDWTRSDVARVQGMRGDGRVMDGNYMSQHDTWLSEDW